MLMKIPLIIGILGVAAFFGWKLMARGAYESAEYKVNEIDGEFEIREYPDLTVVSTSAELERHGEDGSFMRLFRYISGANEARQKVAMTTPVFMQAQSGARGGRMSFVVPKQTAADGAPKPVSEHVELQTRASGRFAVIRFAGRLNTESSGKAEKQLRAWMARRGMSGAATAEMAGYDPPWTPGPLRRNEVLIRLE
jgi:hypothetical protein